MVAVRGVDDDDVDPRRHQRRRALTRSAPGPMAAPTQSRR